jgi:hypothetical protein
VGAEDDALTSSVQRGPKAGVPERGRFLTNSENLCVDFQKKVLAALGGSMKSPGRFGVCLCGVGTAGLLVLLCRPVVAGDIWATVQAATMGFVESGDATGDLNGDGIPDVAVLLADKAMKEDAADKPLALRVYFADKSGKLTLATEAPKAACLGCGGVKGGDAPYTLEIKKGVLSLTYDGGSRETESYTTKWRYQHGDFELVGIHEVQMDTLAGDKGMIRSIERDVNVSTLKMEETVSTVVSSTPDGEIKTTEKKHKCAVPPEYKGRKLKSADNSDFTVPKCTKAELQ